MNHIRHIRSHKKAVAVEVAENSKHKLVGDLTVLCFRLVRKKLPNYNRVTTE
jgi:hypothetical protein